jgi:hypothetical protein
VIGWNRFGDEIYFVIARPNASPFQVPVWMTDQRAAAMAVRESARVDLGALRDLRRLLDATRPSPEARSSTDRKDDDEKERNASAEFIRCADNRGRHEVAPELLKPLVRALLTDLIAAQRLATSVLSPEG